MGEEKRLLVENKDNDEQFQISVENYLWGVFVGID